MSAPPARIKQTRMGPREYIERIAHELGKLRGRGLLLSSADAQLALSWHARGLLLDDVLGEIRRGSRLRNHRPTVRGSAEVGFTLQLFAKALDSRARRTQRPVSPEEQGLCAELLSAAREPKLAARAAWERLARDAETLLASGGEGYWTQALAALRSSLRELPREAALGLGRELRRRLAPRPMSMPRRRYQRSLQLQLLVAASEQLGVPPRAFLL